MKKLLGIALAGLVATTAIGCGPKAQSGPGTRVAPPTDGTAPPPAAAGTATDPSTSPAATPAPPG